MEKIQCVSIPRSGHHLLVNILFKYYSRDVDAYETDGVSRYMWHEEIKPLNGFAYCEFYQHCQTTPCTDARTTFQKNHDLDLELKKLEGYKYIIQYRHPLEYMTSFYKWELAYHEWKKVDIEDSKTKWLDYIGAVPSLKSVGFKRWLRRCLRRAGQGKDAALPYRLWYWKKFVHKWILTQESQAYLLLPYHDFMQHPKEYVLSVLQFMDPDARIDEVFLDQVLKKVNIKQRNMITKFKYYDEAYFRKLEERILPELDQLQIPRIFR